LTPDQSSYSRPFREAFKEGNFACKAALVLSSWFGAGLVPLAPGTFGTLAAVIPVAAFKYLGKIPECVFLIVLISVALWSSHIAGKSLGNDDPPEVVIDEAAGFCVSVLLVPFTLLNLCLGYLIFRLFDIVKPFPIGLVDKNIRGGPGIVLDDILAGLFANIGVRIILELVFY
jgi:phosphatidylglycerophosphatase A